MINTAGRNFPPLREKIYTVQSGNSMVERCHHDQAKFKVRDKTPVKGDLGFGWPRCHHPTPFKQKGQEIATVAKYICMCIMVRG